MLSECKWCGKKYDGRGFGKQHFCSEKCKHEEKEKEAKNPSSNHRTLRRTKIRKDGVFFDKNGKKLPKEEIKKNLKQIMFAGSLFGVMYIILIGSVSLILFIFPLLICAGLMN